MAKNPNITMYSIAGANGEGAIGSSSDAQQGADIKTPTGVWVKADPENTGICRLTVNGSSSDGDSTGFPLDAGETILVQVNNLNEIHFYVPTSGDVIHWIKV